MTPRPRLACLVPFCRRTRHNREGFSEWICGKHWPLVPKRWRRYLTAAKRAWRRSPSEANAARCDRLWRRCRDEAIAAGGMAP